MYYAPGLRFIAANGAICVPLVSAAERYKKGNYDSITYVSDGSG
jgi:hypothetical protein